MQKAITAVVFVTLTAPAFADAVSDRIIEPNITTDSIEVDAASAGSHEWMVPSGYNQHQGWRAVLGAPPSNTIGLIN